MGAGRACRFFAAMFGYFRIWPHMSVYNAASCFKDSLFMASAVHFAVLQMLAMKRICIGRVSMFVSKELYVRFDTVRLILD